MPTPAEQEQAMLAGMNARIARALEGFAKLSSYREDGGAYYPPPDWATQGAIRAMSAILVAAGLLTDNQLAIAMAVQQATVVEESLEQAREHLREQTGITAPVGAAGRPQG